MLLLAKAGSCTIQHSSEEGSSKLLGGRDEHPLKVSVGGKTREPPHSCRTCQSPWKSSINSAPTHVTVAEPGVLGLRTGALKRAPDAGLCVLLQALNQARQRGAGLPQRPESFPLAWSRSALDLLVTRCLFPVPCVQLHTTQKTQLTCLSPEGNSAKR